MGGVVGNKCLEFSKIFSDPIFLGIFSYSVLTLVLFIYLVSLTTRLENRNKVKIKRYTARVTCPGSGPIQYLRMVGVM